VPNQADELPLSVLRIYLRHRSRKPGPGFWGRIFLRSLSNDLAARALKAGVSYATTTLGHAGFVTGAKHIVADISDIPVSTLPTCVELVGTAAILESFVEANREDLADAVLLRIDGTKVSLRGVPA
jgi:PII-like signaling protein